MKTIVMTALFGLGLVSTAGAQELKLEIGIKSEYNDKVGKVNVFTCDSGEVLIELDTNKCSPPDFEICTKRAPEIVKSTPRGNGFGSLMLVENDETMIHLSPKGSDAFEIRVATKAGVETLPAKLSSALTPYPANELCKNK